MLDAYLIYLFLCDEIRSLFFHSVIKDHIKCILKISLLN